MNASPPRLWARYINLDGAVGRREAMEANLAAQGLSPRIQRFPALSGDGRECGISPGELGCFRSHEAILEAAPPGHHVLVLEDDAVLPQRFIKRLSRTISAAADPWDMIFLNQTGDFRSVAQLKSLLGLKRKLGDIHDPGFLRFVLLDAKSWYTWGCAAYVVHPSGVSKMRSLYKDSGHGYRVPVDNLFKEWIRSGRLSAQITFPYLVAVDSAALTQMPDRAASRNSDLYASLMGLFTANTPVEPVHNHTGSFTSGPSVDADALAISRIIYRYLSG